MHFIYNFCRVEFQNKFFKADGYKYQPFSFAESLSENKLKEYAKEE